jgi:hypothetical protein
MVDGVNELTPVACWAPGIGSDAWPPEGHDWVIGNTVPNVVGFAARELMLNSPPWVPTAVGAERITLRRRAARARMRMLPKRW